MYPATREDQREQRYQRWLELTEREDEPERRDLWFRRYQRPEPPSSLPLPNLSQIRGQA